MTGFDGTEQPLVKEMFEEYYREEIVQHFQCAGTTILRMLHYRSDYPY